VKRHLYTPCRGSISLQLKPTRRARKITKHFDGVGLHPYGPTIKTYMRIVTKIRGC
jgi:hypothetical protein